MPENCCMGVFEVKEFIFDAKIAKIWLLHGENLKGHSTWILKNWEKILKNVFTNMTPLQFLQLTRLRKSKRKNFMFSS